MAATSFVLSSEYVSQDQYALRRLAVTRWFYHRNGDAWAR